MPNDERPDKTTVHLTSDMVRVLAHPLRAQLLALLRIEGPATASSLAARTGTNSGATSYHLRQLADAGLVVDDAARGNKRERWWRSAHDASSWRDTDHDDDDAARAASDWLMRYHHRQHAERVDAWHDARLGWSKEWRDAADQSDFIVSVDPARLAEMSDRIRSLIAEYEVAETGDDSDVEQAAVLLYSFPLRAVEL